MLFLSILTWLVVIYSFKIVFTGNPAYDLVKEAPKSILQDAANYVSGEEAITNESSSRFVERFLRLTTVAFLIFIIEIGIVFYFIVKDPYLTIPWILMIKNIIMVIFGYNSHRQRSNNVFESILDIPSWAITCERISYLITATGFLFLFLLINNLIH